MSHTYAMRDHGGDLRRVFPDHRCMREGKCRGLSYARISQDREGTELGIDRQHEDNEAQAANVLRIPVGRRYSDDDIGASARSRPKPRKGYEGALAAVRRGDYCVIVAYSNSRLTRRPSELEELIVLYEKTGVLIATVKSGHDDLSTADGRMMARMKAAVDAGESDRTAERVARAARQRREHGRAHGGSRVFGYVHPTEENGVGYCQVIDKVAAVAIDQAIQKILGKGTLTQVQHMWNAAGVRTPFGKPWLQLWDIARALMKPRIAALVVHKGVIIREGDWPALIDRATHEAVVQALQPKRRDQKGKRVRKYLLPGYTYCVCGSAMVAQVSNAANRYVCVRARGGCGKVSRSRPWLEDLVRTFVSEQIVGGFQAREAPVDGQARAIAAKIAELEAGIERCAAAIFEGVLSAENAAKQTIPAKARIDQLRREQGQLANAERQVTLSAAAMVELLQSTDPETLPQRRAILGDYIERIIVMPLSGRKRWGLEVPVPVSSVAIIPRRPDSA